MKRLDPYRKVTEEKDPKTPNRYIRNYEKVRNYGTVKSKVRQNLLSSQPEAEYTFVWTNKLRKLFIVQLFIRMLIEVSFLFFYYLIQSEQHNASLKVKSLNCFVV